MKKLASIRGAVCVENTRESIEKWVCTMCSQIINQNKLVSEDIVSIQFSLTDDVTAFNPATALRLGNIGCDITQTALFCCQEPKIEGSMKSCIRTMITAYIDSSLEKKNIYLNGAEKLRSDYSTR